MSKHSALDTFGRSGNPLIRSDIFARQTSSLHERMTLQGAVDKTGILLFLTVLTAALSWSSESPLMGAVSALGALVAVISGIATFGFWFFFIGWIVKPRPHLAPKPRQFMPWGWDSALD